MPLKSTSTTEGGKRKKKSKIIYRASENIRITDVFLESLLSESFPSLEVTVHLTSLGCPPVISGPIVGAAQILTWPYSCVFLPPVSMAVITSEFFFFFPWELSMSLYILHRHRVCLDDHVDLICSLYRWGQDFGSSSLATQLLGFNCGFISTSACGSSTGVCS